jgi:molybdate transport system substrate-binding protein
MFFLDTIFESFILIDRNRLKKLLHLLITFLLLGLPACGSPVSSTVSLYVFAAASLSESFEEIAVLFENEHSGLNVELVFAGSQQLAIQIREGAQADVFASANQLQMDSLIQAGMADSSRVAVFASNRLVVIVPSDNPAGVVNLQDLALPVKRLVQASPEVPAGVYTLEFLAKAEREAGFGRGYQAGVLQNVVSYENDIKAVLAKVTLGEADAGIVYSSDAGPDLLDRVTRIEIPVRLNITAVYPIVALNESALPSLSDAFVAFVFSSQGQAILADHGFGPAVP